MLQVDGLIAARDMKPYIQLRNNGEIFAQLTLAEARSFASDIVKAISRTEADAIIRKFFMTHNFPEEGANALMIMFRQFRHEIDKEKVKKADADPDTGDVFPYEEE